MKIVVIGGGIGGFTAALALQSQHEVHVYEKAVTFKPLGTGIGIGSNALQALMEIGVGNDLKKYSNPMNKLLFKDEKGQLLNAIQLTNLKDYISEVSVTVNRGKLHQLLYNKLNKQTIYFNKQCIAIRQKNKKVYARFQDNEEVEADLLIAADGITSTIRQAILPQSKPNYAGYTCWRGITENNGLVDVDTSCEIWSPKGRFGYAPLIDNQIYWFACINAKQQDEIYQHLGLQELAEQFNEHPSLVQTFISHTKPDHLFHQDISDINPISQFAFQRIVLLGDAAHAATPNMGQGAGQAIEDAVSLAQLLKSYEVEKALKMYEKKRIKHTKKVIQLSRLIGKASQIKSPPIARVRNIIFQFIPSRLLQWRIKFLFERNLY